LDGVGRILAAFAWAIGALLKGVDLPASAAVLPAGGLKGAGQPDAARDFSIHIRRSGGRDGRVERYSTPMKVRHGRQSSSAGTAGSGYDGFQIEAGIAPGNSRRPVPAADPDIGPLGRLVVSRDRHLAHRARCGTRSRGSGSIGVIAAPWGTAAVIDPIMKKPDKPRAENEAPAGSPPVTAEEAARAVLENLRDAVSDLERDLKNGVRRDAAIEDAVGAARWAFAHWMFFMALSPDGLSAPAGDHGDALEVLGNRGGTIKGIIAEVLAGKFRDWPREPDGELIFEAEGELLPG
jgi:hypothetical protein